MNSFFVNGKPAGLIMATGSLVLLLMLSDLLYKGILIAADAADAAIRNRERRDVRLLTDSGMTAAEFHGTALPLLPALAVSWILRCFYPGKFTILLSALICMWGIGTACILNIRYCCSCNAHAVLFIRKFHAAITSCQDRRKALDEACAALPAGTVRSEGIAAGGMLTRGTVWPDAVRAFDNGMFSGKSLAVFLNLYAGSTPDPDESVVNVFAGTLEGLSSDIRERGNFLDGKLTVLAGTMLVFSVYSLFFIPGLLFDRIIPVILIISMVFSGTAVLFRNMCVKGRLF